MSAVESLIEQLQSTTVEEKIVDKEVSFVGLALTLDTEEDAGEIVKAIQDCPGMTTLRLDGNTIGIPAAKAIGKALETQSDFKNALWKDMFTRRDKTEIPKALSHLSDGIMLANAKLVILDLSDNAFGPRGLVGIQKLIESSACYTLQELHLNNNGLGIQGAGLLSDSVCKCIENSRKHGTPMQLKVFVCGRNRLENNGAISVSRFLKQLGTLESIAMPQNGIYSPGIKELADAFSLNKNLKVINLEDNSLTKEGAQYIASCLPSVQKLEMLNLGDCLVRTAGALSLAEALEDNCPDLRDINLGFNEISIEGGEAIVGALETKDKLETLILNGNSFGEDGCQWMKSRMSELNKTDVLGSLSEDEGENDDEEEDDDEHYEDEEDGEVDEEYEEVIEEEESLEEKRANEKAVHKSPMDRVSPADFISKPSAESLIALCKAKENFSSILTEKSTAADYLEVFWKISLVVQPEEDVVLAAATKYADELLSKAFQLGSTNLSDFNNQFLVSIGLLKDEDKKVNKNGVDISGVLLVLSHSVKQSYFDSTTRDLLQFFLSRPLQYVTASGKTKHLLMQTLYQI